MPQENHWAYKSATLQFWILQAQRFLTAQIELFADSSQKLDRLTQFDSDKCHSHGQEAAGCENQESS